MTLFLFYCYFGPHGEGAQSNSCNIKIEQEANNYNSIL